MYKRIHTYTIYMYTYTCVYDIYAYTYVYDMYTYTYFTYVYVNVYTYVQEDENSVKIRAKVIDAFLPYSKGINHNLRSSVYARRAE